jgi:hypothetical protein
VRAALRDVHVHLLHVGFKCNPRLPSHLPSERGLSGVLPFSERRRFPNLLPQLFYVFSLSTPAPPPSPPQASLQITL